MTAHLNHLSRKKYRLFRAAKWVSLLVIAVVSEITAQWNFGKREKNTYHTLARAWNIKQKVTTVGGKSLLIGKDV